MEGVISAQSAITYSFREDVINPGAAVAVNTASNETFEGLVIRNTIDFIEVAMVVENKMEYRMIYPDEVGTGKARITRMYSPADIDFLVTQTPIGPLIASVNHADGGSIDISFGESELLLGKAVYQQDTGLIESYFINPKVSAEDGQKKG